MSEPALALAFASHRPIGFAYGFTLGADMPVWPLLAGPAGTNLPPAAADEGRLFFMLEMAVDPGWRRLGVGQKLHDTLIATREEKGAILTTTPTTTYSTKRSADLPQNRNIS